MTINDIVRTKQSVLADGFQIDNEMIRGADVSVIGHFGNAVSLNVYTGCCGIIHDQNNTQNLGLIIQAIVELLDLTEEDGFSWSKIKNVPIRIISKGPFSKVVGFGHFMKDQFVYTDDLKLITKPGRL